MDRPALPPLVLLHGLFGEGADFLPLVAFLKEKLPALRVLTPDLPGHGSARLEEGGSYSASRCAEYLVDRLAEEGITRCVLAGYSMGGRIALQAAVDFPALCAGLIGISTSAGIDSPEERKTRRLADKQLAEELCSLRDRESVRQFFNRWWTSPPFCSSAWTASVFSPFLERRVENWNPEVSRVLRECGQGEQAPLWGRLRDLAMPALFLAGAEDEKYAKFALRMARECQLGTALILPKHGHAVPFESPEGTADGIASWMLGAM